MAFDNSPLSWLLRVAGGPIGGLYQYINDFITYKKDTDYAASRSIANQVSSGSLSAENGLAQLASSGSKLSPEVESYLNNMLANQRTNEARAYETQMANTDLLRAASQLGALGLSPSNVLSTGGSAVPSVAASRVMDSNDSNQRLQRATSIANSMIGLSSRLAGSGIYGSALKSVRAAGAKAASFSAHSAMRYFH